MPSHCTRPGSTATPTCERNSGLADRIRTKIQLAQHKGLALEIEDVLCGGICVNSIRDQISAHHASRLTVDVMAAACQRIPRHVTESILADLLAPLGYVAVPIPSATHGDTMSALAIVGAEVGDVHRVVPSQATRTEKLREISEAIRALERVAEVL